MFYDLPWLCIYNGRRESRKCQGHKLPHISKTNHATLYVCFILTIKIKPFFRQFSKIRGGSRAQMCHEYHELYYWRKKCHVEIFGLSIKNLNNLWSFIKVYAIFVPNLCGEKMTNMKSGGRFRGSLTMRFFCLKDTAFFWGKVTTSDTKLPNCVVLKNVFFYRFPML